MDAVVPVVMRIASVWYPNRLTPRRSADFRSIDAYGGYLNRACHFGIRIVVPECASTVNETRTKFV